MKNATPPPALQTRLTRDAAIRVPLICGAMYPCSNPELVAAVSGAGGIGIVQPLSLTWVHGYDFREGLRFIRSLTSRPIGMNALIEGSSRRYDEVADLGLPVVCAGGVSTPADFAGALDMGYDGVQMGTRFIATPECTASAAYKDAIVRAGEDDVVLTERLTGIPVAVLRTPAVREEGTRVGPVIRRLLRWRRTRHLARAWLSLRSARRLKRASGSDGRGRSDYWQAGRSVAGIEGIVPAADIVQGCAAALTAARGGTP